MMHILIHPIRVMMMRVMMMRVFSMIMHCLGLMMMRVMMMGVMMMGEGNMRVIMKFFLDDELPWPDDYRPDDKGGEK
jgi:hypothetical protein